MTSLPGPLPATGGLDAPAGTEPLRILLVEDDAGDAFLVREHLQDASVPVDVVWVRSLAAARATLREEPAHCVLLDLGLPDANGLEGLRALLRFAGPAAVIVLTGQHDEQGGADAVAAGAQDYLLKGQVDGPLLSRAVRYAVGRRRAEESLLRLYESEVRGAENIRLERGLLPRPVVTDPALSWTTRYRPGRSQSLLGGDFYDLVETADGRLHVLIGDVMGHGPDEAALGVGLRIGWRTLVLGGVAEDAVLRVLDELLVHERQNDEIFATVCTVVIGPDRASAAVRLAGHPAPVVLARPHGYGTGPAPYLLAEASVGPALGVVADGRWPRERVALPPGWSMLFFTDGLIEGRIGAGSDRLGVAGLLDILGRSTRGGDPETFLDSLIERAERLHGGPLADDVALLLLDTESG